VGLGAQVATVSKTKIARHKRLLEAGYFPEDLPPPFNTRDLAKFRNALLKQFLTIPHVKNDPWYYQYRSTPAVIYFPRFGKQDRKHHILNPISFFFLSREISDSWVEIRKSLKRSKSSASNVVFNWKGGKSLLPLDFGERDRRVSRISVRNSFVLVSDISRFYHSVYTHSLAWAVHTKSFAKKNRSNKFLGNRLDLLSRNAQDGQTIGIPVGPDTSRILAELVAVAIDADLTASGTMGPDQFVRFVDDFALGASSREQAERLRSVLRRHIHSYELEINEEKTQIKSVFGLDYSSWRHEIRAALPGFGAQLSKLELYFDKIYSIGRQNPTANCLRYALKQSRAIFTGSKEWPAIEDFLLLSYRMNPTGIPTIVEIIVNRHRNKQDVDLQKIRGFIVAHVPRLAEMEKHAEVAWMLYLALELAIKLPTKCVQTLFEQSNPVCALLICDLSTRGLLDKPIDRSYWNTFLDEPGLRSEMWLYSYEGTLKGWTGKTTKKFVAADQAFGPLLQRKISFYDIKAHVDDISVSVKNDITSSKKVKLATLEELDEIDFLSDADFSDFDDTDTLLEY
jgi:hypothetical protein